MEVVAIFALFAEAFEPMFADVRVVGFAGEIWFVVCGGWMTVGASSTEGTVAGEEVWAGGYGGYEMVTGVEEKGGETEGWDGRGRGG